MTVIGKNIRKIRTVKKLSQAAFAEIFHLARPSVGAYEEERSEPKLETVIQIANHFGISVDSLLTKELTINDLYNFNVHLGADIGIGIAKETKRESGTVSIKSVFVPSDKQLEYIVHIHNRDFLSTLPKILVPGQHSKDVRAFEMTTDDMHHNAHGLNLGDMVFGKKMGSPFRFSKNQLCIIVAKDKIIIRRVEVKKDHLRLKADNENYEPLEIPMEDIIEMWQVIGYFSMKTDAPPRIPERILQLENNLEKLNSRVSLLESAQK